MKPLVGITGRRLAAEAVASYHPRFADLHLDVYWSDNGRRIHQAGGIPVLLPFESAESGIIDRLDALLITGGQDVHPDFWGGDPGVVARDADPRRDANVHDRERDVYEIALVREAVDRELPVLGICRGNQVLNVALGGTLVEDVPIDGVIHAAEEAPPTPGHANHIVRFDPGSVAESIYGAELRTNSLHHQAVKECGPGVVATGRTSDGSIESIELTGVPMLGVQWHPEWHIELDPVFPWLVHAAQGYRRNHLDTCTSSRR